MDDHKIAQLRGRAQHLTTVKQLPSWQTVREIATNRREKTVAMLISAAPVDERELHRLRGFVAGLDYLIDVVENGEKELEKATAAAQRLEGGKTA